MSFINSLIEKLNDLQNDEELNKIEPKQLKHILKTASDTIWELSEKMAAANMERSDIFYDSGWIPVSVRLPETPRENPFFDNKPLELYLVTIAYCDYPFRAFWNGKNFTDGFSKVEPIAWMPLPKIYEEDEND